MSEQPLPEALDRKLRDLALKHFGFPPTYSPAQCIAFGADAFTAGRQQAEWQPIATAPKDGTAVLGYGLHSGSPPDAQRGVKAGDHWWSIMLWDVWRNPDPIGWGEQSLWVFAKDGKPTWSHPSHWMPLPDPPPVLPGVRVSPSETAD